MNNAALWKQKTSWWVPVDMRANTTPMERLCSLLDSLSDLGTDQDRCIIATRAKKILHLCEQIEPDVSSRPLKPNEEAIQLLLSIRKPGERDLIRSLQISGRGLWRDVRDLAGAFGVTREKVCQMLAKGEIGTNPNDCQMRIIYDSAKALEDQMRQPYTAPWPMPVPVVKEKPESHLWDDLLG